MWVLRGVRPWLPGPAGATKRSVGVKQLAADDIATHVAWLRSTVGTANASRRIPLSRKVTRRRSIQGMWTPDTFAAQRQQQAQQAGAGS